MRAVPPAFSNTLAAPTPSPVGRRWKWLSKAAIGVPPSRPGNRKTTLVYSILHWNAMHGNPGLFVSLEQEAPDIVRNMAELGMPPLPEDRLYVLDTTHLRLAFRDKEKGKDWIKILSDLFEEAVHASGYKLFALDSL